MNIFSRNSVNKESVNLDEQSVRLLCHLYLLNLDQLNDEKSKKDKKAVETLLLNQDDSQLNTPENKKWIFALVALQYKQLVLDLLCAKHSNIQNLSGLWLVHIAPRFGDLSTILLPRVRDDADMETLALQGWSMAIRHFVLFMGSSVVLAILAKTMTGVAALAPWIYLMPMAIFMISLFVCLCLRCVSDHAKEQIDTHNTYIQTVLQNDDKLEGKSRDDLSKAPLAGIFKLGHAEKKAQAIINANTHKATHKVSSLTMAQS